MALTRQVYPNLAAFPLTGLVDIIYVDASNKNQYLWSGSAYVAYTPSEIGVSLGNKSVAWFTANDTLVLGNGQHVYLTDGAAEFVDAYVVGDGVTELQNLPWKGLKNEVNVNTIGAAINAASTATPNDTDLVMSVDASVAKKNTWTQIKAFLKTYFDTIYTTTSAVASQITTALSGYVNTSGLTANYIPKATDSDTLGNSQIFDNGTNVGIGTATPNEKLVINGNIETLGSNSVRTNNITTNASTDLSISPANNLRLITQGTERLVINSVGAVSISDLTASQIVETNASNELISAAKQTGYNLALGTTAGTVLEGDRITQTITNGVTTSAPSEDAVFDALEKGTKTIYIDLTTTDVTPGTTAITILKSALINGGTFIANDTISIKALAHRGLTSLTGTQYLYINTTNSLSGAALIGTYGVAGFRGLIMFRDLFLLSQNQSRGIVGNINNPSTYIGGAAAVGTFTSFDFVNDLFVIQAYALADAADTSTSSGLIITRTR
jgi:hypothetical protein